MHGSRMRRRTSTPRWPRGSLALVLLTAACSGVGGTRMGPPSNPNVVGRDEMDASSAANAYDLVVQVRPNWLRGRGTPSIRNREIELPIVYLEDRRQGPLEVLRSFPTSSISELRYIDGTTATTRFGIGHGGGVIQVVPRKY